MERLARRTAGPAAVLGVLAVAVLAGLAWPVAEREVGARSPLVDRPGGTAGVAAHRGALGVAHNAGNRPGTLAAAGDAGADVLEVDVVEVGGKLRAGRDHGPPPLVTRLFQGPALDDVWRRAATFPAVQLDLKQTHPGLADRVGEFVEGRTGGPAVFVSSRSPEVLHALARRAPGARLLLSIGGPGELERVRADRSLLGGVDGVTVHQGLLDPVTITWLGAGDRFVIAWTVDDPHRAADLLRAGVDGVSTDNLAILRALADGAGERRGEDGAR